MNMPAKLLALLIVPVLSGLICPIAVKAQGKPFTQFDTQVYKYHLRQCANKKLMRTIVAGLDAKAALSGGGQVLGIVSANPQTIYEIQIQKGLSSYVFAHLNSPGFDRAMEDCFDWRLKLRNAYVLAFVASDVTGKTLTVAAMIGGVYELGKLIQGLGKAGVWINRGLAAFAVTQTGIMIYRMKRPETPQEKADADKYETKIFSPIDSTINENFNEMRSLIAQHQTTLKNSTLTPEQRQLVQQKILNLQNYLAQNDTALSRR